MRDGHYGKSNVTTDQIHLKHGARPITHNLYRNGPKAREIVVEEVGRMRTENIIELTAAEWASLVVVLFKHDR